MMSSAGTDDVESQHHVFPVAALLVWLHHASASVVSQCVCVSVCVRRSVCCGFQRRSDRDRCGCLVRGVKETGSQRKRREEGDEY